MVATPRYLSGSNGFIPEATGQVIAFVRKPDEFKVNKYVQLIDAPEPVGVYAQLDYDQPTRVVTDEEWAWEDGDDRPQGNANQAKFVWQEFRCFRRDFPYRLGEQAIRAAKGWNPKAFYDATVVSQCMTNRTKRVIALLENTANWTANGLTNTSDANVLNNGAGKFPQGSGDPSSPNYLAIKKALLAAARLINLTTNSVVKMKDLRLVISPGLAILMAETDEINSFLKSSPFALAQVRGDEPGQNQLWGLPDTYAGIELVVEDASYVNIRANSSANYATPLTQKVYVKQDNSAVLVSRVGGLDGNYGAPSFSTIQLYYWKYLLAIEAFDDPKNKRLEGHVVEQIKEVLAAPPAGYLITNVS